MERYKAKKSFVSKYGSATAGEVIELKKEAAKKLVGLGFLEKYTESETTDEEAPTGELK